MKKISETKTPVFACDLTTLTNDEREQLMGNSQIIFSAAQEIRSLPDGYALSFPDASAEMIARLSSFIAYERLCCSFIRHSLIVEPYGGETRLELTGDPEVKEYITSEISSLLPDEAAQAKGFRI